MTPIEFDEVNLRIAESQEEYNTVPAFHDPKEGTVLYCMQLTEAERQCIYATGELWVKQLTFNTPMQPILMSIRKEDLLIKE